MLFLSILIDNILRNNKRSYVITSSIVIFLVFDLYFYNLGLGIVFTLIINLIKIKNNYTK